MPAQEHRRVANQQHAHAAKSEAEWEQVRRALLMLVAQFRADDPDGVYTLDVRVVRRAPVTAHR